jgi:sirohydrochlorin cobaltochelatase
MASVLKQSHRNVFLGTLEGYPGLEDVVADVEESGVKKVRLIPFLLVAGGHVFKDVAGENEGSWKSTIERQGFETKVHLQGLGNCTEIIGLFLEHTKESIEKMEKKGSSQDYS